jgi:hypothetical protein
VIKPAMPVAALLALLGACATVQPTAPQHLSVNRPAAGQIVAAGLGDVILERAESTRHDGVLLQNEVSWFDLLGLRRFTLRPGPLVAREADRDFTYYYSDRLTARELAGLASSASGGICIRKDDAAYVRVFTTKGFCSVVPDQPPRLRPLPVVEQGAENYRQEIIYRGRSGSVLSFVYRELRDDQSYPSLSLDFQIDITDSSAFGLRGARVEVIEATNSRLTYRVISSFAEPQR